MSPNYDHRQWRIGRANVTGTSFILVVAGIARVLSLL